MEETPEGTPVGVDDPYDVAGRCDHLTDDGRCRYALEHAGADPGFSAERRADGYACVVSEESADPTVAVDPDDIDWAACPHYRWTTDAKECIRCGLTEVRLAHESTRPLVEEHHLSYGGPAGTDQPAGDGGSATTDQSAGNGGSATTDQPAGDGGSASTDQPAEDGGSASTDQPAGDGGSATTGQPAGDGGSAGTGQPAEDGESDGEEPSHEITVGLCRWCHTKVHRSFARITDDATPDPEAIAAREQRRGTEMEEFGFQSATERREE